MITSDSILQRASLLGTQVISKATAKRLGIVTQLWLDVDQRQVMGLSVAERFVPGTAIGIGEDFYMSLERVSLLGPDAILVDDEDVLEDLIASEKYTSLIGNEVVTESGELLGKVHDFKFEPSTGDLLYLVLSSLGAPIVPTMLISTYELDVNEIIAVGRDRIIVTEGMEERMTQLTKGLLERIGLGKPPWEQEFEEEYLPPTSVSGNALGTGTRSTSYRPAPPRSQERPIYRREESWDDDDNWAEERVPPRRQPARFQQQQKPIAPVTEDRYDDVDDYDDDNWEDQPAPAPARRSMQQPAKPESEARRYEEDDVTNAWADENQNPIPKKVKQRQEELEEI